ncbi:MAG: ketopantoate reductase family protein [Lachnospiraceae bacterium]|nr:ketopantoate reductase family protein [Lachnospiraceae bacterium]
MIKTVGIVGLGALGVLYGSLLLEKMDREDLLIIADGERIRRYQAEGVYANGKKCDFRYVTPEEGEEVDLLIFAVKYMALEEAMEMARPFCGERTIVMSFLNGVSSEQMIENILKPKRLLYSCVQGMDATRKNRQVFYSKVGYIAFGEKDSSRSEAVCEVEEFFGRTGLEYKIPEDIRHQLYSKWMLNVGVNQTCAVFGVDYGGVQKPGKYRDIMVTAMKEAGSVAAAEGIQLTEEDLQGWLNTIDGLAPNGQPSMRQDALAGRQTEVELFAGTVCALGRRHGIPVPQNEEFYRLLTRT